MSLTLYELASEYQQLIPLAETADDEGELQAFYDTLEGIEGEIGHKLEGCAHVARTLDLEASAIEAEAERLLKRAQSVRNSIGRLKGYMQNCMEAAQMAKHKGERFTIWIQDNPVSVKLAPEIEEHPERLPEMYQRHKVEADKAYIKVHLLGGMAIDGCELARSKGIRIR